MRTGTIEEALERLGRAPVGPEVAAHVRRALGAVETSGEEEPLGPAFLRSVVVEGFRGIGPATALELAPGPGLTLVLGRNGSGKSSFVEGLEVALRGDSARWRNRPKTWQEGWRNLHHDGPRSVRVQFHLQDHPGPTVLAREWTAGAGLEDATSYVQHHGEKRSDVAGLGWQLALETTPPLLSYNELGSLLEAGPSKLYDSIAPLLGLEPLTDAAEYLRQERLAFERDTKAVKATALELIDRFADVDDPRARDAAQLMGARQWDLDAIERLAAGQGAPPAGLSELSMVAAMAVASDALIRFDDWVEAAALVGRLAGTGAAQASQRAGLLEEAVAYHSRHRPEDCPVCGQGLPADWLARTEATLEELRAEARQYEAALRHAEEAMATLCSALPALPAEPSALDIAAAKDALAAWQQALDDPDRLTEHRATLEQAVAAASNLRDEAQRRLGELEDRWRPIATDLIGWVADARPAMAGAAEVPALKEAETWLAGTTDKIRTERFAPIAQRSREIWEALSLQSNVRLDQVVLSGKTTNRRVDVSVSVDDTEGVALGVMSQGELHSLALSLFLPRATEASSPFRFVVIDDPVQAMDPARVEGLARVLHDISRTRQVVVLTHDDRLRTAVWRLDLPATVIEVTRRRDSKVELRSVSDPVAVLIGDAKALAATDGLPPQVAAEVIPGYCRQAIEAACHEVVWLRRTAAGVDHHQTEQDLDGLKLSHTVALALFDDADEAGKVLTRLNQWGGWAGDVFVAANKGAHGNYQGSLGVLINDTERLCKKLRELP